MLARKKGKLFAWENPDEGKKKNIVCSLTGLCLSVASFGVASSSSGSRGFDSGVENVLIMTWWSRILRKKCKTFLLF